MLDGVRRNYQFNSQLPGGAGDLTLVELQEMATKQQQVVETQQQVLVVKEQRLKYLRQQEARHAQLASESERLRKIRERVENQELKLKKLRALRDQAEQYRINNGNLNSELEAVKTVFSEKEKELAMAVAKVDQLTRQLKDLKNGVNNGMVNNNQAASNSELEKLRKELLMRNKLNEQQTNMIATKEKLLNDRREKVALMDVRIHKLQQRLKKRQLQEQQAGVQGSKVVKYNSQHPTSSSVMAVEPYNQYLSQNNQNDLYTRSGELPKQDSRYQILPSDSKSSNPSVPHVDSTTKRQDVNISEQVDEYKLPVVLPVDNSKIYAEKVARQNNHSYTQRPPPPERSSKPYTMHNFDINHNSNIQKLGLVQYSSTKPTTAGSHFFPVSGNGVGEQQETTYMSNIGGGGDGVDSNSAGRDSSSLVSGMLPPSATSSSSIHPIINISDEERQAGSGQSSPASTESSPNSGSGLQVKDISEPVNTSSIGPVSAMIEKLNKSGVQPQTSATAAGLKRLHSTQKPHGQSPDWNDPSLISGRFLSNVPSAKNRQVGSYSNTQGSAVSLPHFLPQDEVDSPQLGTDSSHPHSPITSSVNSSGAASITNQTSMSSSGGPHLNQKPAMTYRYASKNTIANTYMGRLGGAAMEKYQKNLNLLYKSVDSQESKEVANTTETATSFTTPLPDTISSTQGHPQFGAAISSPGYPDIASDKGSFKLHTPKQVRRRHSDSENEDLNKALQEQKEREQHQQQQLQHQLQQQQQALTEASQESKSLSKIEPVLPPPTEKSKSPVDKNKPIKNTPQTSDSKQPESPVSTAALVVLKGDKGLSPPTAAPATKSASASKIGVVVLRSTKSNLKKDGKRKSNNRVSFDPLALLLDASLEGELDLVRKVALQVDDVSTPNDEGITALHNAICAGHYDIVTVLIEFGCDVNSPDSDGWTPLHCAASCNNLPMVRFLVEHGACVFATTISDHETAADKCEEDEDGYDSCSDYLYSIQEKLGITNNGEVYAVFDYQATNTDELSFRNMDKMTVLRKGDDSEKEWWWAQINGKEGYIPRNLLGLYPRVVPKVKEVSEC
uniref:SH3 domain-containing protein n=1 Tax=Arion vulgaris TaxID=1028688 RepID=A0A0B7A191_9EUPU